MLVRRRITQQIPTYFVSGLFAAAGREVVTAQREAEQNTRKHDGANEREGVNGVRLSNYLAFERMRKGLSVAGELHTRCKERFGFTNLVTYSSLFFFFLRNRPIIPFTFPSIEGCTRVIVLGVSGYVICFPGFCPFCSIATYNGRRGTHKERAGGMSIEGHGTCFCDCVCDAPAVLPIEELPGLSSTCSVSYPSRRTQIFSFLSISS